MMKPKRRILCLLIAAFLVCAAFSGASAETMQDCHRVTNTATETKQGNRSRVKVWHVETALPEALRSPGQRNWGPAFLPL